MTDICVPAYMHDTGDSNEMPTPKIEKEFVFKIQKLVQSKHLVIKAKGDRCEQLT